MEKIAVFVDNGYLKKVIEGMPVDYHSLSEDLVANHGGKRFRTYVYDCKPYLSDPPTEKEKRMQSGSDKFQMALERLPGFVTRWGSLQRIRTTEGFRFNQKGVDLLLGIDLLKLSLKNSIDTAIIIAGDRDFIPSIKKSKEEGVLIYLYYNPDIYVHNELYNLCDDRFKLTRDFLKKHRIEKRKESA